MKYLFVSDSHGDREILVRILKEYESKVDYLFHCGDSELEGTDELFQHFLGVRGNCDYDPHFPEQIIEETSSDRILVAHGHLVGVRSGIQRLVLKAEEVQANIAAFGHTHELGCEMANGILILNPGSISFPKGPIGIPTFAIVDAQKDEYEVTYYDREFQQQDQLTRVFKR